MNLDKNMIRQWAYLFESEESMRIRLQTARKELAHADEYDERIVNDDLDVAVRDMMNLFERYENET